MPKKGGEWTPQRRAKFDEKRGATAVAEPEPEILRPDGGSQDAGFLSASEVFMARMRAGKPVTTQDEVTDLGAEERGVVDEGAQVTHTTAGLVYMFKKETWGWHRIKVSRNSVVELISAGLLDRCGACGKTTCFGEINQCSKTPKVMYRDCPVAGCNHGAGKRFYDVGQNLRSEEPRDDPFAIRDDHYSASTPESRTAMMLDEHIRYYHTQEAAARGLLNISRAVL